MRDCLKRGLFAGIILETEDSIRKIQKRTVFRYKKVKKGKLKNPIFKGAGSSQKTDIEGELPKNGGL